jgi:hypothetical protein
MLLSTCVQLKPEWGAHASPAGRAVRIPDARAASAVPASGPPSGTACQAAHVNVVRLQKWKGAACAAPL